MEKTSGFYNTGYFVPDTLHVSCLYDSERKWRNASGNSGILQPECCDGKIRTDFGLRLIKAEEN